MTAEEIVAFIKQNPPDKGVTLLRQFIDFKDPEPPKAHEKSARE